MTAQACTGDHTVHICELSRQGRHVEIKKAATYPQFMCMNCGRVADAATNLCNPRALDDIRPSGT
jgi:hypothetical protein